MIPALIATFRPRSGGDGVARQAGVRSQTGAVRPWRTSGTAAGWRDRGRTWSAGASWRRGRRRSASCSGSISPATENRRRSSATDRLARRRTTSARSMTRKAACRPAAASSRPWPSSRPTAPRGCWSSHAPCPAPCSELFGRLRRAASGGASEPSGHPGFRQRTGAPATTRTRASNRPLRAGRSAAGRCCRADVDLRPSRRPFPRTVVWRRPSGFRRSWRIDGTIPSEHVEEFPIAAAAGQADRPSLAWRRQAGRPRGRANIRAASRRPDPACVSAARFRGRQPQRPASPSASGSAYASLRVDRSCRQLEHNKNKCRVPRKSETRKNHPAGGSRMSEPRFAVRLESEPHTFRSNAYMAPRANWKGFLRLSLVTCPVALYPATSESEKISFNQLNRKTGHRIKYAKVDADTGEEVANEDIVKGYKVDTDTFVEVTKEELENVALESTRTIEIDEFVEKEEIDPRYLIRPYYLRPDGKVGHDAFAVIRETIREMGKVAIGRVVLTNREHIIALEPMEKGLMGTLLRYPYEVRSADEYFDDIQDVKVTKDMLDLARHIVNQKAGHFEPDKFEDHYETALVQLINSKRAGKPVTAKARPRGENVVDLMDALRQSIGKAASPAKPTKKT